MEVSEILKRIKAGSILTIGRGKKAHLDKYTPNETEVNYDFALEITFLSDIELDGGNLDTGDKHYQYKNMEVGINVLSLFDGIACGRLALERAGIKVNKYFASEIDPYAIKIAKKNWPDIIHVGDVSKINFIDGWLCSEYGNYEVGHIDLVMGGSPCTDVSFAGRQKGMSTKEGVQISDLDTFLSLKSKGFEFQGQSYLYWEFLRVKNECKPFYFFLENVRMTAKHSRPITESIGVDYMPLNSEIVSAQSRPRFYWHNIPNIQIPKDRGILLKDIVLSDVEPVALHNLYGGFKEKSVRVFENKSPTLRTAAGGGHIPSFVKKGLLHSEKAIEYMNRKVKDGRTHWDFGHHSDISKDKSSAVVANFFKGVPYNVFKDWDCIRKFHPIECERLQGLPDGYTECPGVSNTQRYKAIGNGWQVDTIVVFFQGLKTELESELNSF